MFCYHKRLIGIYQKIFQFILTSSSGRIKFSAATKPQYLKRSSSRSDSMNRLLIQRNMIIFFRASMLQPYLD